MTTIHVIGRVNNKRDVESLSQCWYLVTKGEVFRWKTELFNIINNNLNLIQYPISFLTVKLAIEKPQKRAQRVIMMMMMIIIIIFIQN
jgi:hypothetical protein